MTKRYAPSTHPDRATRFLVEQWVQGAGGSSQTMYLNQIAVSFRLNIDGLRREKSIIIPVAFLESEQGHVPIVVTSHVSH